MPLSQINRVNENIAYAIWDINEELDELIHLLDVINHEKVDFTDIHPKRKMEFLTTRLLIKELCEYMEIEYEGIYKDEFGKPHLNVTDAHISISHSFPAAIGLLNLKDPAGIDIELPQDKINRIKHKFLNNDELVYAENLLDTSIVWSAKETLYKIHGRKSLDFRKHLFVKIDESRETAKAKIVQSAPEHYQLRIERYNDFIFTFNI